MMNNFQSQQRGNNNHRPRYQPPQLYSITRGTVTRIEAYGCFVRLGIDPPSFPSSSIPVTGLVHVSQLHTSRISNVNDVVNINDVVFVKVIDIFVETIDTDHYNHVEAGMASSGNNWRVRHKIKLSMKYVNQDNGQDLDVTNDQLANDMLSQESSSRGSGSNNTNDGGGMNSHLERALASNIGISSAIDPGNLILKGKRTGVCGGKLFNGYALVDEEQEQEPSEVISMSTNISTATASSTPSRPMGRGRGTTLPAWMTKRDENEDGLGHKAKLPDDDNGVDGDRSSRLRNDKRSRTKSKSSRRRRHDDHDDDDEDDDYDGDRSRRRNEKKKQKRRHRRRRSSSSSSDPLHMIRHQRRRSSLSFESITMAAVGKEK